MSLLTEVASMKYKQVSREKSRTLTFTLIGVHCTITVENWGIKKSHH